MTAEFEEAMRRVLHDFEIGGECSDLVAVGIQRSDCLELLEDALAAAPDVATAAALAVQWACAIGVWIERARWEERAIITR